MKKSLFALAALAVVGAASAQSSVTVYGRVDLGLTRDSGGLAGAQSVTRLDSGIGGGSRLGFRGVEDLGGGLKANFVAETGFCADSNSNTSTTKEFCTGGNNFMGRQATVGLSSSLGALDLGRQYTPAFLTLNALDPFGTGYAGQITNLFDSAAGYGTAASNTGNPRMNNAIKVSSANYGGISGSVAYGLGEVAGNARAGRSGGFNVQYANGPVLVALAYHEAQGPVPVGAAPFDARKNVVFGGTYNFGVAKAHFAYGTIKNRNAQAALVTTGPAAGNQNYADARNTMLGVSAPIGAGMIMASYIRHDDRGVNNFDADQFGIGYSYALSKRTSLYTAYAKINNKNNAFYTVGNAGNNGVGNSAFNLGVAHSF